MATFQNIFSQRNAHPEARDTKRAWISDPHLNKGSAFTKAEREYLGIADTMDTQFETLGEQVSEPSKTAVDNCLSSTVSP